VGDFNCPRIHWASDTSFNDPINTAIFNWATSGGFTQHVDFPTRGQNTLDVVFADDDQIINRSVAEPSLGFSDHCVINFLLTVENSQCTSNVYADTVKQYSWHRADFDALRDSLLAINWAEVICYNPYASSTWSAFVELIWEAVDRCVPTFNCRVKSRKTKYRHPYALRKLSAKKRRVWKEHRTVHPT